MSSINDLDMSAVDSADDAKIVSKIEGYYKQDSLQKASLSYHWEKNHLFLDGNQWLTYEGNREAGGIWRKLQPSPQNEYIPRPVTNYIFDAYQTLKSFFQKTEIRSTVRPNTQTNRDKTAAKIAELVNETNWERLGEEENYEYALSCGITYGTVFKKDFWDSSYLSLAKVPRMEQRPVIDPNTGQPSGQIEEIQSIDPMTGAPLFDEIPLGDAASAVVEPYRIAIDPLCTGMHNLRWIMEYSIRPLTWIDENFNKPGEPGYTGRTADVKEEKNLPSSMKRFFQLKQSPGVKGALSTAMAATAGYGDSEMIEGAAVVKEHYEKPCRKYPKGRLFIVANGVLLYSGESPCSGPEQGDWHPYSEFRWEVVPGRFWGKSPFDDAAEIQKHINSIDSVIVLTRKTMAVPQKLVPRGTIAQGDVWTGQPGQKVTYTPGSNGEKPETIPPVGVDQQIFTERAQRVEDFKQITGAIDILKGDRPPGVTAYSALSLLFEVGTGKLAPILKRWKKFIENSQKKQLKLVAKKYREPRPEFIRMLVAKNRDLTPDQVHAFIGSDLYDNCNVVIEASSAVPKLIAAEHAKLLEMAQLGTLNLENPANKAEFNERMGVIGFDSDYSKDAKRASWENDLLDNTMLSPDNKPIRLETDNDDIHIGVHSERTKEPSFMQLPFEVQQAYFMHIQEHQQAKQQAEQMAQMQAMAMGSPPPEPPPNPMDKQQSVHPGKGISQKMSHAINPDLMNPYGVGTN